MKRKLWMILVAAVLLAALWCGAAAAEGRSFTLQPGDCAVSPETGQCTVGWGTNFVPLKVELMAISYESYTGTDIFGASYTGLREKPARANTVTTNLGTAMTFTFTPDLSKDYRLWAYYGTGSEDYVSSTLFRIDTSTLRFSLQPASGSYNPETLNFHAVWTTTFTPVRVEIMHVTHEWKTETVGVVQQTLTWSWCESTETRVETVPAPVYTAMDYPFEPELYEEYRIRAYFDRDYFVESDVFRADASAFAFTWQPAGGSISPQTLDYTIGWTTNFTPVKIEIVRLEDEFIHTELDLGGREPIPYSYLGVKATVEHTLRHMDRQSVYAFVPDTRPEARYEVRAYWSEDGYIPSQEFQVSADTLRFTAGPQTVSLNQTTGKAHIRFRTNFLPRKVGVWVPFGVQYDNAPLYLANSPSSPEHECDFPAEARKYEIYAFYGSGKYDYITLRFEVTDPGYAFILTPEDSVITPDANTCGVSWDVNFTPTRTAIYRNPDGPNEVKVFESVTGKAASLSMGGQDTAVFRLYVYHQSDYAGRTCLTHDFTVTRTAFTEQPQSGTHAEFGDSYLASWRTNFQPKRIAVYRVEDGNETDTGTTLSRDAISCLLRAGTGTDTGEYRIRAWWGTGEQEYISSSPFLVVRRRFVTQPEGGWAESENGGKLVSWKTSFLPSGIECLVERNGEFRPVGRLDSLSVGADGTCMAQLDSTLGGRISSTYKIRVLAFDGKDVESEPFTVLNPVRYRVFFLMNGAHGVSSFSRDVTIGECVPQPEDPAAAGRTFTGWYTDAAATQPYDFNTPVTEMIRLYAGWLYNCKVRFEAGLNSRGVGGVNPDPQTVISGRKAVDPYAGGYATADYVFDYWSTDYEGRYAYDFDDPVTGDLVLYSQWQYLKCEVTIHRNGHGYDKLYQMHLGDIFPQPDDPSDYYCKHLGWYLEPECIRPYDFSQPLYGDLDLYNKWAEHPTVFCYYMDPENSSHRIVVSYGTVPDLDVPELKGYTIQGWCTDEDLTVPYTPEPLYESISLYARLAAVPCTVTFNSMGGSTVSSRTVPYGSRLAEPAPPARDGFVFAGWYKDPDCQYSFSFHYYNPETGGYDLSYWPVEENMTLYARWIPNGIPLDGDHFPDEIFRAFIKRKYDTDKNGYLSAEERDPVTEFSCSGSKVADFTGIEYFTNITKLVLKQSGKTGDYILSSLDVRSLQKLQYLDCSGCYLPALITGCNPELETLYAYGNSFTELNLSYNLKLKDVSVYNCPNLIRLNLVGDIQTLKCYGTALASLDLLGCPNLLRTVTEGNFNTNTFYNYNRYTLTIDGTEYKLELNKPENGETVLITEGVPIDEEHFPDAEFRRDLDVQFDRNNNGFLSEDERAVTYLALRGGQYRSIRGIEYFPDLTELTVPLAQLEECDLSGCVHLQRLNLYKNALTELDVSMLHELTYLNCGGNSLLANLNLGSAPLVNLDLRDCSGLQALDLSGQPNLLKAYMDGARQLYADGSVSCSWESAGSLILDPDANVLLPVWEWQSPMQAFFILPNGQKMNPSIITHIGAAGPDSAGATVEAIIDGISFTAEKTFFKVRYTGTDMTDRWLPENEPVPEPGDPIRVGSRFTGWYTAAQDGDPFDFSLSVTAPVMLYAHWFTPEPAGILKLPAAVRSIESEAFAGIDAEAVVIPQTVNDIAESAFDNSNLQYVYGYPVSAAENFAARHPFLTFIPIDDSWLAGH